MLHLTVLAATGATGRELTQQALARGHSVTAIARDPSSLRSLSASGLTLVAADVRDEQAMARALAGSQIVVSGLGRTRARDGDILTLGARAVVAAKPEQVIWLGAFGTGRSADAAGAPTRTLLRIFLRGELADKVAADTAVLEAGGTVFHAGPLGTGPTSATRHAVPLSDAPRRLFPAKVTRATVAAEMLDRAEKGAWSGTLVPLER